MFQIGDKIVYSVYGICRISDIVEKEVGDVKRKYYELAPLSDGRSTIFTPVDSTKVLLRPVISKNQAIELLENSDSVDMEWPDNVWKRNQEFKSITQNADLQENISLYKLLVSRKQELTESGKKMIIQDSKMLDLVSKLVFAELKEVFGVENDEIEKMMCEKAVN